MLSLSTLYSALGKIWDGEEANLLCLNCRSAGHGVNGCPHPRGSRYPWHNWALSPDRASLLRRLYPTSNELCQRCKDLDILSMFEGSLTWSTSSAIPASVYSQSRHHRDLGSVETIQFNKRCGLCVAIFNITPNPVPNRANVHLLADWTIHRFERLVDVKNFPDRHFDTFVIAQVLEDGADFAVDDHTGDALTIRRPSEQGLACSSLTIEPDCVDLKGLQALIEKCQRGHKLTCLSKQSDSLADITLIGVTNRRLSMYPGPGCKYIVLSYVWGGLTPPKPDKNGNVPRMPATIEDAMKFTLMLGAQYLWVDALCIDQANVEEKAHQISLMADIYRGAHATIVALSGTTSEHGLTRLRRNSKSQPQLSCEVDGVSVVGLMPTLSTHTRSQRWGERAWTNQEALLSKRNIYFTDHQVYFECCAMQSCETIDTSRSWIHNAPRDMATYANDPRGKVIGHGTMRAVAGPEALNKHTQLMEAYGTLIGLYSWRKMTDENDALNAFSGILKHFEEVGLKNGFCSGLPEDELNWTLLWCPLEKMTRRAQFPAWSWAGWRGQIAPGWPYLRPDGNTQPYWTHFCAWTFDKALQRMRLVFPHHERAQVDDALFLTGETPFDLKAPPQPDRLLEERCVDAGPSAGLLLLDCLAFSAPFTPGEACPSWNFFPWEHYRIILNNVACYIRIANNADRNRLTSPQPPGLYVLTAREKLSGHVVHHFLDVDVDEDGKALRRGAMHLLIPESAPQALHGLEVVRRGIILI